MNLRVALYQMDVTSTVEQNRAAICRAIDEAARSGARILLTPEGSLSGYTPFFEPEEVAQALDSVTARARQSEIGLALGTCFQEAGGEVYNQVRFYAPTGQYLGFHSKILRCGSLTDPSDGEINHYTTSPLRVFNLDGLRVGGLICNDLWANPTCTPLPDLHLSQQLARMGARVIFHAVNGGRDGGAWSSQVNYPFHESNLRMRAQAGGVWIVTVDSAHPLDLPTSAPGGVVRPDGEWGCRTTRQGEDLFVYDIPVG